MTHEFRLNDVVRLRSDLPDEGLRAGAIGAVVEVFEEPCAAYEVEFADDEGRTIAQLPLRASQLEPVDDATAGG